MTHGAPGLLLFPSDSVFFSFDCRRRIGEKLVHGIDLERIGSGSLVQVKRGDDTVGCFFGRRRTLIAIAGWLAQHFAARRKAHVVHRPTVDANRCNSLGSGRGGFAQTFFKSG
jgi:hypothetical protein